MKNVPNEVQKEIDEFHETAETIPQISLNCKGMSALYVRNKKKKTNNVHTL